MITLSDKFQLDISSNTYSIQPLIVIDADNNPIYISTYKQSFDIDEENSVYWEDYDLNISNITESIDLKSKKFKTGKLNFSLTNYKVKDKRISDDIAQYSLINKYVDVYYKTQSCKSLDDCAKIYRGIIKSVKHDSKTIRIVLEDLTEDKLNIEVPIANLGYTDKVYNDKYLNKEIPITYGEAFKAPAVLYIDKNSTDENSLFVIADDIFEEERNINLGSFQSLGTHNQAIQFIQDSNPLYLYKEEYFQALKNFNLENIGNNEFGEWDWDILQQYEENGNSLMIPRIIQEGLPANPPAFNEMQTFIVRNPIHMLVTKDATGNTENYLDVQCSNPELAYDNTNSYFLSSNYNVESGYGNDVYSTFASCPPNTGEYIEPEFGNATMVSNFMPHKIDNDDQWGSWLPIEGQTTSGILGEELSQYQFKVFQYLNFNMDKINRQGDFNQRVSYIQMPSVKNVRERLNKILSLFNYDSMGSYDVEAIFNSGASDSAYPEWFYDHDYNGERTKVQAYPLLCSNFDEAFRDSHNIPNSDYHWGKWNSLAGAMGDNQYYPQPTNFRFQLMDWFFSGKVCLVTQRTSFMTGDSSPYNCTFDDDFVATGGVTPDHEDHNTCQLVMDLLYDPDLHGSGYWQEQDMQFHLGMSPVHDRPFLFFPWELPIFTPTQVQSKVRTDNFQSEDYQASIGYECIWNDVTVNAMQNVHSPNDMGISDYKYFGRSGQSPNATGYGIEGAGGTGWGCWIDNPNTNTAGESHPIGMRDVYRMGVGERCWAIWVQEDIEGINEEALHNSMGIEYDTDFKTIEPNNNLTIPKGTILPCIHMTNTYQINNSGWRTSDFADFHSSGTIQQTSIYNKIYDSDSETSAVDNRFGFTFQLDDIDEKDVIKCDTYFSGKVHCIFDTDATTNSSNAKFRLSLSSASIEGKIGQDVDTDAQIFGDRLIEDIPLSDVHLNDTHIWSVAVEDQGETDEYVNHYVNTDEEFISQENWTEPNFFNGFSLNYSIENNENGEASASAFVKTEIYDAAIVQLIQFENVFDTDLYVSQSGRLNNDNDIIEDGDGNLFYKYTGESSNGESSLIRRPQDILYHFIEKEIGLEDIIDEESLNDARNYNFGDYAFSINKKIKAKDFINSFSESTNLSPVFKSTSKFSFSILKEQYNYSDVDFTIKSNDIISYSFSRIPIDKIYTIVNVKYAYDYAKDKYSRETGYVDGYDLFGNGDSGYRPNGYSYDYLKIDREDKVLEFESKYIRDEQTALALRNFLYLWNCNQHNIFELTLPNKYIFLEVGDIIRFDKLINGIKAYGEDYTENGIYRNGQEIYPFFIIDYCSRKANSINLKCTQLHRLERTFVPRLGSITRNVGINDIGILPASNDDITELESFLNGSNKYFTREQRRLSDLNNSGYIDEHDLSDLEELIIYDSYTSGDLNLDGEVNITDLVALISNILGDFGQEANEDLLSFADFNNDGVINVVDVIALVNQILESQEEDV